MRLPAMEPRSSLALKNATIGTICGSGTAERRPTSRLRFHRSIGRTLSCSRPAASSVARRDPRNARDLDTLVGEFLRFRVGRLAIDAARVGLAAMNAARLFGKARRRRNRSWPRRAGASPAASVASPQATASWRCRRGRGAAPSAPSRWRCRRIPGRRSGRALPGAHRRHRRGTTPSNSCSAAQRSLNRIMSRTLSDLETLVRWRGLGHSARHPALGLGPPLSCRCCGPRDASSILPRAGEGTRGSCVRPAIESSRSTATRPRSGPRGRAILCAKS